MKNKIVRRPFISAFLVGLILGGTVLSGASAFAQDSSSDNVFYPSFFETYAPRTAFDMVSRVPGFQIESADDKRGIGQGGANILINGERLAGKSSPFDQLSSITASSVVQIEIVEGASLNIPGLSGQVANITTNISGVTGTWLWRPESRKGLEANYSNYEISVSGNVGNLTYSAKLRDYSFRGGSRGPETLINTKGVLFEIRDEDGQEYGDQPGASVNFTYKPKEGHIANMNGEYSLLNFNRRDISNRTALTPMGQDIQAIFTESEDQWKAGISADYAFPLATGKLKLIGLHNAEHSPRFGQFETFENGSSTSSSQFIETADESESIIRSEYSWSPKAKHDWTIGLEGAFNALKTENQFLESNTDGIFEGEEPIITQVNESRSELTLTHNRPISSKWDLQASIGGEYSKLTQMGGSSIEENEREFYRPKGFAAVTYRVDDSFSIRSKVEREVGQLDFSDFVSSVNLTDNLNSAGNPNLVPSQSWRGEVELDKDFGEGNTLKARLYGAQISDLVDRIPLGIDGDAVGNIDTALQYGIDLSATLKGEKWDLDGTVLNLKLELRDSSVKDPLEGFNRSLNGDKEAYYSFDFRHDIPRTQWAYGLVFDRLIEAEVYRLTTRQQFTFTQPFTIFFVEHKNIAGMKMKVSAMNILNSGERLERSFYDDRRDLGQIIRTEQSERKADPFIRFHVSGTF